MTNRPFQPTREFSLASRSLVIAGAAMFAAVAVVATIGCQPGASSKEVADLKAELAKTRASNQEAINATMNVVEYKMNAGFINLANSLNAALSKNPSLTPDELRKLLAGELDAAYKKIAPDLKPPQIASTNGGEGSGAGTGSAGSGGSGTGAAGGGTSGAGGTGTGDGGTGGAGGSGTGTGGGGTGGGAGGDSSDANKVKDALKFLAALAALAGFPGIAAVLGALGVDLGLGGGDLKVIGEAFKQAVEIRADGSLSFNVPKLAENLKNLPPAVVYSAAGQKLIDELAKDPTLGADSGIKGFVENAARDLLEKGLGEFGELKKKITDGVVLKQLLEAGKAGANERLAKLKEWLAQNHKDYSDKANSELREFLQKRCYVTPQELKELKLE